MLSAKVSQAVVVSLFVSITCLASAKVAPRGRTFLQGQTRTSFEETSNTSYHYYYHPLIYAQSDGGIRVGSVVSDQFGNITSLNNQSRRLNCTNNFNCAVSPSFSHGGCVSWSLNSYNDSLDQPAGSLLNASLNSSDFQFYTGSVLNPVQIPKADYASYTVSGSDIQSNQVSKSIALNFDTVVTQQFTNANQTIDDYFLIQPFGKGCDNSSNFGNTSFQPVVISMMGTGFHNTTRLPTFLISNASCLNAIAELYDEGDDYEGAMLKIYIWEQSSRNEYWKSFANSSVLYREFFASVGGGQNTSQQWFTSLNKDHIYYVTFYIFPNLANVTAAVRLAVLQGTSDCSILDNNMLLPTALVTGSVLSPAPVVSARGHSSNASAAIGGGVGGGVVVLALVLLAILLYKRRRNKTNGSYVAETSICPPEFNGHKKNLFEQVAPSEKDTTCTDLGKTRVDDSETPDLENHYTEDYFMRESSQHLTKTESKPHVIEPVRDQILNVTIARPDFAEQIK